MTNKPPVVDTPFSKERCSRCNGFLTHAEVKDKNLHRIGSCDATIKATKDFEEERNRKGLK